VSRRVKAPPKTSRDADEERLLAESRAQLARATGLETRLAALAGLRASQQLVRRDHRRSRQAMQQPEPADLEALRRNLDAAWTLYMDTRSGGVRTACRALGGVRNALANLRAAEALLPPQGLHLKLMTSAGKVVSEWGADPASAARIYGVPRQYLAPGYRTVVKLSFYGQPSVWVKRGRRLVWRNGKERHGG